MDVARLPYGGAPLRIGELSVLPIFDGYTREYPAQLFAASAANPDVRGGRPEDWLPHADLLDADGLLGHGTGGFLIDIGDRRVLIDAGVGPEPVGPYGPSGRVMRGGEMPGRLRDLGVDPAEITDVVLTHLHFDHYGWAAHDHGSTFPRATFRCHTLDWDHFVLNGQGMFARYASQLASLAERVELWDGDQTLFPGLDLLHAPGHTPGNSVVVLSSGAERAVLLGDVVHCPVELLDSEWAALGDVDPAAARQARLTWIRELEDGVTMAAGAHFPGMRFGRVLRSQTSRRWFV